MQALRLNNEPAETWRPLREKDRTGVYAQQKVDNNIPAERPPSNQSSIMQRNNSPALVKANPTFDASSVDRRSDDNNYPDSF